MGKFENKKPKFSPMRYRSVHEFFKQNTYFILKCAHDSTQKIFQCCIRRIYTQIAEIFTNLVKLII